MFLNVHLYGCLGNAGWCHVFVICTACSDSNLGCYVPVVFCATLVPCWMLFALRIVLVAGWAVRGPV